MGAGEYVSDDAVNNTKKQKAPIINGILMFFSYILAGLLPLLPVVLAGYPESLVYGVLIAFAGLFTLGWAKGKILGTSPIKSGLKILLIGGLATMAGITIGSFFEVN
jgi:VIT1/CCC1 family predicted Fe2+/Mn2+ transporter